LSAWSSSDGRASAGRYGEGLPAVDTPTNSSAPDRYFPVTVTFWLVAGRNDTSDWPGTGGQVNGRAHLLVAGKLTR
jgi:hypothetical protein